MYGRSPHSFLRQRLANVLGGFSGHGRRPIQPSQRSNGVIPQTVFRVDATIWFPIDRRSSLDSHFASNSLHQCDLRLAGMVVRPSERPAHTGQHDSLIGNRGRLFTGLCG
jgi:hypothetical protein